MSDIRDLECTFVLWERVFCASETLECAHFSFR